MSFALHRSFPVIDLHDMTPLHITPKLLKEIRTKLGLTQKEAAARCRVQWRAWAAWEGGERIPTGPCALAVEFLYAEAKAKPTAS